MFDIFSWQHIIILLVVALVVVGPKDLPRMMHMAGKWAGKARAMAAEFRKSFDEMARQTELDELRKEIEDLKKNNPVTDMVGAMNDATSTVNDSVATMTDGAGQMAEASAPVEGSIEPRSGEFEVTETSIASPAAAMPSNGPAAP
jgi:sec-independent protein translocase protein TatB